MNMLKTLSCVLLSCILLQSCSTVKDTNYELTKEEKEKLRDYLISAYSGDEKAMLKLSELYQKGILVDKDEIHGKFWLQTYYNTQYKRKEIKTPKTAIKIDKNLISKENKPHWVIMPDALDESSRNYIWYFDVNSLKFRDENNLAMATVRFNLNAPYANEKLNLLYENEDTATLIYKLTYDCKNNKIKYIGTAYINGTKMDDKKDIGEEDYKASPHKAPIDFLFEDLCQ